MCTLTHMNENTTKEAVMAMLHHAERTALNAAEAVREAERMLFVAKEAYAAAIDSKAAAVGLAALFYND